MLVNLVQNGIDAVECSGGPTASGTGEPGEVVVISAGLSEARDLAVLRVRDNGCGMPPEVLKDIFTPFYTTKQLGKGTGMGLVHRLRRGENARGGHRGGQRGREGDILPCTDPHRRKCQGGSP